MGQAKKKYWKGFEELTEQPSFIEQKNKEFREYIPVDEFIGEDNLLSSTNSNRRDFLKFLGFSVAAATVASCETPITKAIPYVIKPEESNPGVANYYASTYFDGNDYSSVLVKTREGRPIHIEGNPLSSVSGGRVNARVNSSVLSLYDSNRAQSPMDKEGNEVSWEKADKAVTDAIKAAVAKGGKIRLLSNTMISPTAQAIIDNFIGHYGAEGAADVRHVMFDNISYSGIIAAHQESFNKPYIPNYRFDKAQTIVSIGADFLSTWLSSIEYSGQYAVNRKPDSGKMSKHFQFETGLSVTGSNADHRTAVLPSEYGTVAINLHNAVAGLTGNQKVSGGNDSYASAINHAAEELASNQGKSLVVCGSNNKNIQVLVNSINHMLKNYGSTVDIDHPSYLRKGNDADLKMLADEMNAGKVDVLINCNVNPVWTLPSSFAFASGLEKVGFKVSTSLYRDETAQMCDFTCPDNHYLESWGDANPCDGKYALTQPAISPLYNTRQLIESISIWSGGSDKAYDSIRKFWNENLLGKQSESVFFDQFWNKSVEKGVFEIAGSEEHEALEFTADVSAAASGLSGKSSGTYELFLYQKTGIGDGRHANNPWLQELPDPITKITWDNYVTMAASDMIALGFNVHLGQEQESNMITITSGDVVSESIPVVAQPGQMPGTLGLALGYGHKAWKIAEKIGVNAYPFTGFDGTVTYEAFGVTVAESPEKFNLAATQTSHTIMGRDSVVRETTLETFNKGNREEYNPVVTLATHEGLKAVKGITLWEEHKEYEMGHLWGMSIDLNTCTGCGSCVTACFSENNIPIVGKDEVRRGREMHWMRIDRYYSTDANESDSSIGGYRERENPGAMPEVVFQPMMCQHCNNAPCETVCPVAATTHSSEGLNQMTYNRCIGTRYCANNCPYKVRRFNWFNYIADSKFTSHNPSQDDLGRMVLNPDVTVRARGVMEKCSMCVQRIQTGKLEAKKKGTAVEDGAISTACASACPTNAITFGDFNDKKSALAQNGLSDRAFRVIEDVGTKSNVIYMTKVRNKEKTEA